MFSIIVIVGYLCGIAAHLVEGTKLWLVPVYLLDILLVSTDLALYFHYRGKAELTKNGQTDTIGR